MTIKEQPGRGRSLVAARDLAAGEEVNLPMQPDFPLPLGSRSCFSEISLICFAVDEKKHRDPLNQSTLPSTLCQILVESAYASVVLDHCEVCHGCFAALPPQHQGGRIPCSGGCGQYWCSDACQTEADRAHKGTAECKSLGRLDATILNEGDAALARLFVKLLCRRAAEEGDKPEWEGAVGRLESNPEKVGGDRLSELGMVAEAILDAVPGSAAVDEEVSE